MTTHHPMSTAAKQLTRALRQHEQAPSADTAAAMVAALRDARRVLDRTDTETVQAASRYLSVRELARLYGYSSHTPMRRKLTNNEEE